MADSNREQDTQRQIDELKTTVADLRVFNTELQTNASDLRTWNVELRASNASLQQLNSSLQATIDALKEQNSSLQVPQSTEDVSLNQRKESKMMFELLERNRVLQESNSALEQRMEELQQSKSALKATLSDVQQSNAALQQLLDEMVKERSGEDDEDGDAVSALPAAFVSPWDASVACGRLGRQARAVPSPSAPAFDDLPHEDPPGDESPSSATSTFHVAVASGATPSRRSMSLAASPSFPSAHYLSTARSTFTTTTTMGRQWPTTSLGHLRNRMAEQFSVNHKQREVLSRELLRAARMGHTEEVSRLLQQGANIAYSDSETGWTALHYATDKEYLGILSVLISAGAPLDSVDTDGRTAVYWAAYNNRNSSMDALLEAGAPVDTQDRNGQTPLHAAVLMNWYKLAQQLLAADASFNIQDNQGETPLHIAARENSYWVTEMLMAAGADPLLKDINGKTALDLAPYSYLRDLMIRQ